MAQLGAGQAPYPTKYWDQAAIQENSLLLDNAAGFPDALRQLFAQKRHEDLHAMLSQIKEFKEMQLLPEHQSIANIVRIRKASDTLLACGILDVCIDIALDDRWYDTTYHDSRWAFAVSSIF